MSLSSRDLDRIGTTFDNDNLVTHAGLVLGATLVARLGLESLINTLVRTGSFLPGRKVLTLVTAMMADRPTPPISIMLTGCVRVRPGGCWGFGSWRRPRSGRFCGRSRLGHRQHDGAGRFRVLVLETHRPAERPPHRLVDRSPPSQSNTAGYRHHRRTRLDPNRVSRRRSRSRRNDLQVRHRLQGPDSSSSRAPNPTCQRP